MSQNTKIRGGNQIKDSTITNQQIATDAAIETSKLAEGQEFLKRDGSVPLTGDLDAGGNKIENLGAPVGDNDAARKIDVEQGDADIQSNIDSEESARIVADDALDVRLNSVEDKDLEQDGKLTATESDIDQLQIDLSDEESARIAADADIQDQITDATDGQMIYKEVPSGVIDGVNTVFILANTPALNSEQVFLNGVRLTRGVSEDYTISGATITLSAAPGINDVVLVNYHYEDVIFSIVQGSGTDLSGVQADISTAQGNVSSLDSRADILEPEIDVLQAEFVSIDSRVDFLETNGVPVDLTELEQDVLAIDGRLDTAEVDITNLQNDINSIESRSSSAQNSFNNLSAVATSGSYNDLLNLPATQGMNVDWQYFSSSGTWTKPAGAKLVYVICVGAGAGGGSGRRSAASSTSSGGNGGAGGSIALAWFHASQLSNTETVTVGLGGAGGEAITTGTGAGNAGSPGGQSCFGGVSTPNCKLGSSTSNPGLAPNSTGGASSVAAATSANTMFTATNNSGAQSTFAGSPTINYYYNSAVYTQLGPAGGAGAGRLSSSNNIEPAGRRNLLERNFGYVFTVTSSPNATAQSYTLDTTTGGISPAGGSGADGLNATTDGSSPYIFGGGAAGGIGSLTLSGGNGGNGGTPGGGGGGGAPCRDVVGASSGAGGRGGDGGVYVITYY